MGDDIAKESKRLHDKVFASIDLAELDRRTAAEFGQGTPIAPLLERVRAFEECNGHRERSDH